MIRYTLFHKPTEAAMTDHTSDAQKSPSEPPRYKTPLWVKGFLAAVAVLVVVFAVMHLSGGTVMNHTP